MQARARLVWEQGARVKFHYTEHEHATRILAEQAFRIPQEPGSAGHGLYVTTVQPRSMLDEKLLDLLFARGRARDRYRRRRGSSRRRLPVEALLAQELRPQCVPRSGSGLVACIGRDRDTSPGELAVVGRHLHAAGMMIF
jgi:hypothetical protein